jgi:hypothetical protein
MNSPRLREAREVAQLREQDHGRERIDPPEAAEPAHMLPVEVGLRQGGNLAVQPSHAGQGLRQPVAPAEDISCTSSRQRSRSQAAPAVSSATVIGVSSSPRKRRTTLPASPRSVLMRSPGLRGVRAGAITRR